MEETKQDQIQCTTQTCPHWVNDFWKELLGKGSIDKANCGYVRVRKRTSNFSNFWFHRAVWLHLAQNSENGLPRFTKIPEGFEVHHMDFNKQHNCPSNLLLCPPCLHIRPTQRCPYTAKFMSTEAYKQAYDEVPF